MKFKLRRYYLYYLGRSAAFLFALLPFRLGVLLGSLIGRAAFYLLPYYRRLAIENLNYVFGGEKSESEVKIIARRVFENLGRNAAELINFPKVNASNVDRFVSSSNMEAIDGSFKNGKGTVVVTAHLGNWEITGAYLRLKNYPGVAIGKRIYFDKYDKFLNRLRKSQDVNIVYRDSSPKILLKLLRENKIVGVVADQDVDSVEGVFVDFFGKTAYTPVGPAALAMITGASLIPVFAVREGLRHRFIVEDPIKLANTGDRKADLVTNTQKWSLVVESYIRKYPEQWVWIHRRWKTRKDQTS
ncbi:MAG: lysophospholipid acyltransferase family protein [Candidatus Omnitrophica bacterium]|nr:lysophospholipid acyltransferase family protein [Candidatus Omnitrophota bacterium]